MKAEKITEILKQHIEEYAAIHYHYDDSTGFFWRPYRGCR